MQRFIFSLLCFTIVAIFALIVNSMVNTSITTLELPEEICQVSIGDTLCYTTNNGVMNVEFRRFSNGKLIIIK